MKINIYGSGCSSCQKLYDFAQKAVEELKLDAQVNYINDISKIIEMGIMQAPVLTIDDKAIIIGNPGNLAKVKKILQKESKK